MQIYEQILISANDLMIFFQNVEKALITITIDKRAENPDNSKVYRAYVYLFGKKERVLDNPK